MVVDGGATPTGLIGWITEYGNVVYFFGQLIFWLVLSVAAIWATLLFRKLVNARIAHMDAMGSHAEAVFASKGEGAMGMEPSAMTAEAEKPSIDEFVD